MRRSYKIILRYLLVGVWAVLTVALVFWWYIFGSAQLERLESLGLEPESSILAYQRMLFWEGGALILLVLLGGVALSYQVFREIKLNRKIQLFFLTFAHELKTPLTSLRLQAESLKDLLLGAREKALAEKIINDTVRLNLQLENSLLFSQLKQSGLLGEKLDLDELIEALRAEWPELDFSQEGRCVLSADRNAMQAIMRNLVQNALVHGSASKMKVSVRGLDDSRVQLRVQDNGRGFVGDFKKLGTPFIRHSSKSGNGLGLFLVRELLRRMGGEFKVVPADSGFAVELMLRGKAA